VARWKDAAIGLAATPKICRANPTRHFEATLRRWWSWDTNRAGRNAMAQTFALPATAATQRCPLDLPWSTLAWNPPTNAAERPYRQSVIQRKISHGVSRPSGAIWPQPMHPVEHHSGSKGSDDVWQFLEQPGLPTTAAD